MAEYNKRTEPEAKRRWELEIGMHCLRIGNNIPGPKPTWKYTEKEGAQVQNATGGGIDWWCHGLGQ
jgi:hypothetical protein